MRPVALEVEPGYVRGMAHGCVESGRRFARKVARRIAAAVRPDRIYLFGSFAYGRPTAHSDIDLLVIGSSKRKPHDRVVNLYGLVPERPYGIDFVYLTPGDVRRRLAGFDPFLEEVLGRGIVLHASKG